MKKIIFVGIVLFLTTLCPAKGQGIQFFQGSLEEVFKKAQAEQKKIFFDFYTVWCGPCKLMSRDVFTNAEVGTYFNDKFVNYQINAEDKKFSEVVKAYKIQAYPTLLILDASGNVAGEQQGALDVAHFLKFARTVNGDILTFEKMYDKLKTDKDNEQLVQALLLEAPDFISGLQEGSNYDRWSLRVERLYADHRKKKSLDKMMNPTDFAILMTYHPEADKEDEILNYIMQNYADVVKKVGQNAVFKYVFTLQTVLIEKLARKGDTDYLKCLERLKGDMKPVYDSLMNFNGTDAYTGMKCLYDGDYYIYNKKDVDKYFGLRDDYFRMLGNTVTPLEYRNAVDAMYEALNGKFTPKVAAKAIEWITVALQGDMESGDRMEVLLMLGDCHKMQNDKENARKCYNQAYMLSLQFNNPGLSARVKQYGAELENQ